MLEALLGVLLGALIVIQVERLRRPRLKLRLVATGQGEYQPGSPAKQSRFIHLHAVNEELPSWARWMSRNAAVQCRGTIAFHHLDGQNVFGRSMPVKWVRTAEALPMQIRSPDGKEVVGYLVDPLRIMRESRDDIAPGEAAAFDTVVRFDEEAECYGWNMESYRSNPPWRNPSWKLSPGRYLLSVEIFSGDQTCMGLFRLINDVPVDAFRLEAALPIDVEQMRRARKVQ
jgi:hypothetical protein